MIEVIITANSVGRAFLYEKRRRQGRRTLVPTYRALAKCRQANSIFEFQVTRAASRLIFQENVDRFGPYGECPPNLPGQPYSAFSSNDEKGNFCLRLYEESLQRQNQLRGQGSIIRTDIMLHGGTGMSEGCLMVSGGKKGYLPVVRWFKNHYKPETPITVTICPL